MKILIYGSKGWIGKQFIEILNNNKIFFIEGRSRLDNISDLKNEIKIISPTHIISFIGRTHGEINNIYYNTIDYLEQDGKLDDNIRDNLFSPLVLALVSKNLGIHYTYLGTGCIYNYNKEHPYGLEENGYNENDIGNFKGSSYSIVKGYTDNAMHEFDNVLNLRIRMPITENEHPRNFITKITLYENICSIPNSMSVLPDLLPKIITMMELNITGTFNFTNPGLISHNEILIMFKELVEPSFTWKNFTIEEQKKLLDSERSNNYLDTSKLENLFPDIKNIKESVRNCLLKYKKNYTLKKNSLNYISKIKNLMITGGCGFIGSNFINYFYNKYSNINIINIDKLNYCANINNIEKNIQNSKNYTFIKADINNKELINYILINNNIDTIIHFAAQSHVDNSFENSLQYTIDNVQGTHNLLECCRIYGKLNKFIHVSTDEVYGESMIDVNEKSKTEHSILCPTNPYAGTKAAAELIVQSYSHSYNLPIIITRGNNVFGPNQYPEKLIPKFIKLLKENKKVTIHGNGTSKRSFLHSSDTVSAFKYILDKGINGNIYNIGCDENMEYSVLDIAKILIKNIKNTENYYDWIEFIKDRPYNDKRYYINNDKLKNLGWKIETKFIEQIHKLIDINQ